MHKKIYKEFERICKERYVSGKVLEIGAIPSEDSLLNMKALKNATEKIGINLDSPYKYKDFKILKGNANNMPYFKDNSFDAVLCNAVLQHDKFFWKTISEIKRITKPGGLIVMGAQGYIETKIDKLREFLRKIPGIKNILIHLDFLNAATVTYCIHNCPGDYYRFSSQTVKQVFFEGMRDIEIFSIMFPPRIIGAGIKQ